MPKRFTLALAGNPNCGKTTIFNELTGSRQHVGNYPGVTVEKKEGFVSYKGYEIKVVDLPGTYSLTAYSPDEIVARDVIVEEKPDVVVNIVDASNLERNLYLTLQIKELEVPLVMAMNMADVAEASGLEIDYELLSRLLGVKIVRTVGTRGEGITELLEAAIEVVEGRSEREEKSFRFREEIEKEIEYLTRYLPGDEKEWIYPRRWTAIKLLESDKEVIRKIKAKLENSQEILSRLEESRQRIENMLNDDPEMAIIEGRYAFIRGAYREAVREKEIDRFSFTEAADKVLLNRVLGIPIFLGIMWLLFQFTFTLGAPFMEWIEEGFAWLGEYIGNNMNEGMLNSLLVDGIIAGVGGVIVFLPNILLLFLGISFLEGTGYMARAAFVMDKVMHRVGLHGKSFVPMLTGFGCNIPAIMATRTLENPKDRLVTILITPLMSCGARLPVYTLLIAAFFPKEVAGNVLFSLYLIGIILALLMAKVFRTFLFKGESEPFVMELPIYRLPTLKSVLIHMWERAWLYLRKAGTIILAISVIMWALLTFPMTDPYGNEWEDPAEQLVNSYAGRMGQAIEPVLEPIGFDWRTGIALIAGFAAKEVVVSTLGTIYSIGDVEALEEGEETAVKGFAQRAREQSGFTPLTAYVLMLFTLLYVPCMATLAVIKRETGTWKWPLFTVFYTVVLAWTVCFIAYQGGKIIGL
ncbi:ferrous iron transport protein B [Thermosyntropha lipolytica DSM 11003]|uniref:Ferrous iron transport protein B n=1 Tax=Thermosyntropha lipolytica DSM 11003 TaxID=1123382 RepID=A0A1M5LQ01_9FIRM|nr:ferrous iron transport protein B [Thermosyntropha lipolytica]SHG67131.1 ferrous iron transport protein B [Thermosyntropha lipolytica DSM 11003]